MAIKVMMVDDEKDFLELMGIRVREWGFEFIGLSDSTLAVSALENERPDVIILDYMMPVLDGIAVLKKIRENNKKIPVIMFTAYPNPKAMQGAEDLGVIAFIPKLSAYVDMQAALRSALGMAETMLKK